MVSVVEVFAEDRDWEVSEEALVEWAVVAMADKVEGLDLARMVSEAADQEAAVTEVPLQVLSAHQEVVDMAAEAADTAVHPVDA